MSNPVNLDYIQGDILSGLPKKGEVFYFFQIKDGRVRDFCTGIGELSHLITSVTQCEADRQRIIKEKERAALHDTIPKLLEMSGINIAFSHKGLRFMGIRDKIGDDVFEKGMLADADGPDGADDVPGRPSKYLNDDLTLWEPQFKEVIHGVILITGSSHPKIQETLDKVTKIFKVGHVEASIQEVTKVEGHVRPGDVHGHEHFGFADGIAQPAIDGIPAVVHRGQEIINQGVILIGRPGDEVTTRPSWALDGSFLCFRKLKQNVPEFQNFLKAAGGENPELLGARLVGRWKSGAPVDIASTADDPVLAKDPSRNDNFRYDQTVKQQKCPYAAHTRKTNPRDDLGLGGAEKNRIIRRGIQYGPEVTDNEEASGVSSTEPELERGLLFACYQSNLARGFQFLQKSWANNTGFIFGKADVNGKPGFDAIIGAAHSTIAEPSRFVQSVPSVEGPPISLTNDWVIPKGGEYFFSPSIAALQETFAQAA